MSTSTFGVSGAAPTCSCATPGQACHGRRINSGSARAAAGASSPHIRDPIARSPRPLRNRAHKPASPEEIMSPLYVADVDEDEEDEDDDFYHRDDNNPDEDDQDEDDADASDDD